MTPTVKIVIGLAATVVMGWVYHAPLGNGEAFVGGLEAQARAKVAAAELPGIAVSAARQPMSRTMILSGPADQFQREGMGEMPGLTGRVEAVEGVAAVRWADEGKGSRGLPLFAELLAGLVPVYLLGLLLGRLLFRPKRETYL